MSGRWVSPYVSGKRVMKEPWSLALVVVGARARAVRVWVCVGRVFVKHVEVYTVTKKTVFMHAYIPVDMLLRASAFSPTCLLFRIPRDFSAAAVSNHHEWPS